jgi:hypothetical protein
VAQAAGHISLWWAAQAASGGPPPSGIWRAALPLPPHGQYCWESARAPTLGQRTPLPKHDEFPDHFSMTEGGKSHPLKQMFCPSRTDDGMAHLGTPSLQKAELLKVCLVLPHRHLLGLMLHRKLILEEGDLQCKNFRVLTTRGQRRGIFCLHSGYPLQHLSLRQSGSVLHILDMKGCAVLHRNGERGRGVNCLCARNSLSCLGHLCLQCRDICAALG